MPKKWRLINKLDLLLNNYCKVCSEDKRFFYIVKKNMLIKKYVLRTECLFYIVIEITKCTKLHCVEQNNEYNQNNAMPDKKIMYASIPDYLHANQSSVRRSHLVDICSVFECFVARKTYISNHACSFRCKLNTIECPLHAE